jgi:hypothetical protein
MSYEATQFHFWECISWIGFSLALHLQCVSLGGEKYVDPIPPAYATWWVSTTNLFVVPMESIPGLLKRFQIWEQSCICKILSV